MFKINDLIVRTVYIYIGVSISVTAYRPIEALKPGPHAAMLYTRDGTFQSNFHAMLYDAFSNMLEIWLTFLDYLSYLNVGFFQMSKYCIHRTTDRDMENI